MDGVGDEVAPADAIDGSYRQGKDGEFLLKADSGSKLESHEMTIPIGGQYHGSFSSAFATIIEGKNTGRDDVSQQACASSHHMDGAGVMVEELTLKDYNDENLAIVGTSNNRDRIQTRQTPWQHLYQIAGVLETSSSQEDALHKDYGQANSNSWEGVAHNEFSELWGQNPPDDDSNEEMEHLSNNENKAVASNYSMPPAGIRTKMLSKCGFSEYFVKNNLKGKGVICKGPPTEAVGRKLMDQTNSEAPMGALNAPLKPNSKTVLHSPHVVSRHGAGLCLNTIHDRGILSLRECLKDGHCKANKVERLYMFRQIVELVDISHSQGVVLHDLRPSHFKLLPSNQVIYNGISVWQENSDNFINQGNLPSSNDRNEKRPLEKTSHPAANQLLKRPKLHQFPLRSGFRPITASDLDINITGLQNSWNELNKEHYQKRDSKSESNSSCIPASNMSQLLPNAIDTLEEKWYSSPEELSGQGCTFSSNIYVLGVFLFELLGSFDSERARAAAMSDLRHRILPPNFLSENPKEAGFCLWLLHPDPSSRPTAREVLQSDVISGIVDSLGDEVSSSIDQDDNESELLLHFLLSLKEHKQKDAVKLVEEIKCLEADIEEVERRQSKKPLALLCSAKKSIYTEGNWSHNIEHSGFRLHPNLSSGTNNEFRLMKNISQLESAYFSMRSKIQFSDNHVASHSDKELLKERDNMHQGQENEGKNNPVDCLGAFFSGLCKYARYSKFEVRGTLRKGDFQNSTNVICSLSFDRDQEYFAAAGVSKRIKIYEFQAIFNEAVDIHYPAIEMLNRSKLSCVCWNSYIRNYLASTDYDGIVKLWDAGTGQGFSQYIEHNKRAWSVDFSPVDPTKLASGSDDGSVKLWNINERNSLSTIRNVANVCCVQFSSHSTHLLAFGSADYKISCYDLRNVSSPWCVLAGHDKAVSYVKFLDSETIVSASTDNTLKLWDLNKTSSAVLSTDACISTLRGHTNQKNFVGLSVADGYIACGSETNEVYSYYRFLPMPITSHKFGSIDPISGKETDDDNGQFVSSVCWRQKSDMLVAANSSGCIKVLQMV